MSTRPNRSTTDVAAFCAEAGSERSYGIVREALRVHPQRHIFRVAYVSVYEGGRLLFITINVKRDHLEVPESRRQVPDGGDPHAHLVTPNPITRVVKTSVQKFLICIGDRDINIVPQALLALWWAGIFYKNER